MKLNLKRGVLLILGMIFLMSSASGLQADVNNDGVVNILDLVLISQNMNNPLFDPATDINNDNLVNILDLVLAARSLGMVEEISCLSGSITSNCDCGGQIVSSGYCCSGQWQSTICIPSSGFKYVLGTKYYPPLTMSRPAKAVSFLHPDFNTQIHRVSDQAIDKYNEKFMENIYSTVNIEMAGGKYILLGTYNYYLYEVQTSKLIKKLKIIRDTYEKNDPEVRPDPADPNIFYYLSDTILYKYDIRDDSSTSVHNFRNEYPSARWIQTETQGDPSIDGRYWAFEVERWDPKPVGTTVYDLVVYDKQTDKIISKWKDNYPTIDVRWISMSPSGERVVIKFWDMGPCARYSCVNGVGLRTRMISFNRNFQNPIGIFGANGHADKAITADGRDVIVFQHTAADWHSMAYLDTGQVVKLTPIKFSQQSSLGFHYSGNNVATPGWALVSTYGWDPTNHWQKKQLFMLELKENPRIWRLSHSMTQENPAGGKSYFEEAFATISRSGNYVWWGSNWNSYNSRLETYQITLPTNWWEDLS